MAELKPHRIPFAGAAVILVLTALGIVGLLESHFLSDLVRSVTMTFSTGPGPGMPKMKGGPRPDGPEGNFLAAAWIKVGWYAAVMVLAGVITVLLGKLQRRRRMH